MPYIRDIRKAMGLCVRCASPAKPGDTRCAECVESAKAKNTERNAIRRASGLCLCGGKLIDTKYKTCSECRTRENDKRYTTKTPAYTKAYRESLKRDIVQHYGGKCACLSCGEDDIRFLTVDHINNDGSAHRKKIGIKSGLAMYLWIRKNNYPDMFQILCWNCNCGRQFNGGMCPHISM